MALITDIQKLEPGGEVRLYEIDGSEYGADILRFHGHAIPHPPEELATAAANSSGVCGIACPWKRRISAP